MKKNILNLLLGSFIGLLIGSIIFIFYSIRNNSQLEKCNGKIAELENTIKVETDEMKKKDTKIKELEQEDKQKELKLQISDLSSKITTLNEQKQSLEKEIEKLNASVIKAKGQEKTYPAGYLTAGKDFEIGRYKIYGGTSNFVVNSSAGSLRVNIILRNDSRDIGISEYLYTFSNGDIVKANSSFKMIPIE